MDKQQLWQAAEQAREQAYAPYSQFRVGAALLSAAGQIFCGANVENASYGLTVCAERVAVYQALMAGARDFRLLAVAAEPGRPILPCGACLQVLREFTVDLTLLLGDGRGGYTEKQLAELLPYGFQLAAEESR